MAELTNKQEDFLIESGIETLREKRKQEQMKKCDFCGKKEELIKIPVADDIEHMKMGVADSYIEVCKECEESLEEERGIEHE